MFNLIKTIGIIDGRPQVIDVEVSLSRGKPQLVIIGLASKAIDEAKERISSALFSCDIKPKAKHTVVNLAPADVRKEGSGFDLPITVGICKAYGLINFETKDNIFIGEITLDGRLRKTKNILPFVLVAQGLGYKKIIVPKDNFKDLIGLENLEIYGAESLQQILRINKLDELSNLKNQKIVSDSEPTEYLSKKEVDLCDIIGLDFAKRAVEIMVAGGHNLLFIGTPGAGKSTLAKASMSILPELTLKEAIETSSIYAQKNLLKNGLIKTRPFRNPHSSITEMSLIGGGKDLNLGEISLAHNGILFLDELSEFRTNILDQLRSPLENGSIRINRMGREISFPADFIFLGATNPCPCGYKNSKVKKCLCSEFALQNFNKKFSGPIMDRIDMKVYLDKTFDLLKKDEINNKKINSENSAAIKKRVESIRAVQKERFKYEVFKLNGKIPTQKIDIYCKLTKKAQEVIDRAYHTLNLSNRSYFKTIKLARTIADIEQVKTGIIQNHIEEKHVMEALQYRL